MGRSSLLLGKSLPALSPRSSLTARLFIGLFIALVSAAMATGVASAGTAMRGAH
jgi:hypothetical protein